MNCEICGTKLNGLTCSNEHCGQEYESCCSCKKVCVIDDMYDYRGSKLSCGDCIDSVAESREFTRQEIIQEEHNKTNIFKGLDLTDSVIGKGNRELLKARIEISSKESGRLKDYEGR